MGDFIVYAQRSSHRGYGVRVLFAALAILAAGCSVSSSKAALFSLGTARLEASGSGGVSIDFIPGGTVSLSATTRDDRGYSWTLTLPPDALPTRAKVTLSTLATITAPSTLSVTTGVQVSPAGLTFGEPATLSVQAPTGSPAVVGYYVTAGNSATIAFGDVLSGGVLRLFGSSIALGSTHAVSGSVVKSSLTTALDAAASQPDAATPPPPSVPFSCDASALRYDPSVNSYILAAEEPARGSLLTLLASLDAGTASGALTDSASDKTAKKTRQALSDLTDALVSRTRKALADASDDDAAYVPVSALVGSVQHLQVATTGRPDSQLSQRIDAWAATLQAKYCSTS